MTCQELDRLLYPYLDGEFQPEERVDLETHLSGCAACRRRVENETQMRQALRRAARHSVQGQRAPASLRAGIQTGLHQEMRRAQYGLWLRAGAVALVMVTVGGGWVTYQSEQHTRVVKREAVQRHSKPLPFEIEATATEPIAEWFRGKVDHRITVPRLPKAKPLGGRISVLDGKEVAYISYETLPEHEGEPSHRLGVFVRPNDASPASRLQAMEAVEVDSTQGFNVVTWRDDEIVYEMVTDMTEEEILQLLSERDQEATLARKPQREESEDAPWSLPPPPRTQPSRPPASIAPVTYPR